MHHSYHLSLHNVLTITWADIFAYIIQIPLVITKKQLIYTPWFHGIWSCSFGAKQCDLWMVALKTLITLNAMSLWNAENYVHALQ